MASASAKYVCELCNKEFSQKGDYTKHKNKKSPCISIDKIQELAKTKEAASDDKLKLINLFKNCLNVLRDNEGLTGDKALRNMSYLIILKLIEPHIGTTIDFDTYEYEFDDIVDEEVDRVKTLLLKIARFSNLSGEKDEDIPKLMRDLWKYVLSRHPATSTIFLKGKKFDIERQSTYVKLIKNLNSIDIAIMEKADNVYVIPSSFGWSDLGTWASAYDTLEKDYLDNAVAGDNVMVIDATKNMIHADNKKLVLLQGLEDFIIVDTKDVLLICKKDKEQEIKEYVAEVKRNKGEKYI